MSKQDQNQEDNKKNIAKEFENFGKELRPYFAFCFLKPEILKRNNIDAGEVLEYIIKKDFNILKLKKVLITTEIANKLGIDHPSKKIIVEEIQNQDVICIILYYSGTNESPNTTEYLRDILGATLPKDSKEGTIRNIGGKEEYKSNVIHATDDINKIEFECELLFGESIKSILLSSSLGYEDDEEEIEEKEIEEKEDEK